MRPRVRGDRRVEHGSLASLLLIGTILLPGVARAADPRGPRPYSTSDQPRLEDELRDLAAFGFSGAVLVSDRSGAQVRAGFGYATPEGARNSPSTAFDIGSLAKQFTSAAVLALRADGKLALADSVGRFFPASSPPLRGVTLTQLLTHTSGLTAGNVTGGIERGEFLPTSRDSALARIFRSRLRFVPGTDQAYSNAGYVLLAAIIEQASGESYPGYLHRRLFSRAGLRDTRFWGERGAAPAAHGNDELGSVFDPNVAPLENWAIRGAGGILSSIDDLDRWMRALAGGRVLPRTAVREMMSAQSGVNGFGWRIGKGGTRYEGAVYHGGDFHGIGSQLIWYPKTSRLVVVLCNIRHENDTFQTRVLAEDVIYAEPGRSARRIPQVKGPAERSDRSLAGEYRAPDGARFSIAPTAGGLELGALDQRAVDFLWAPLPDTAAYWQSLDERTVAIVRAAASGDSAGVRGALSPTDDPPYVYAQLVDQLRTLVSGDSVVDVTPVGTWRAASPPGALWTVVHLRTPKGATSYLLRWHQDVVGSYHPRAPRAASPIPLARATSGWVAWNPVHQGSPIQLTRGRPPDTLTLRREGTSLEIVRAR